MNTRFGLAGHSLSYKGAVGFGVSLLLQFEGCVGDWQLAGIVIGKAHGIPREAAKFTGALSGTPKNQ